MNFTNTEKDLAEYILSHVAEIIHMNQNELANAAFVSPSCVSRFCRKMQCRNYGDFKVTLTKELESINSRVINANYPFKPGDTLEEIAQSIYSANVSGLNSCKEKLDTSMVKAVIEDIISKGSIDIYGLGITISSAAQFSELMSRIGYPTHAYQNMYEHGIRAQTNPADHLVIIISHSGKMQHMINVAKILYERGSSILLITANRFSAIRKYAKYVFIIDSGEELSITGKQGMFSSHTGISYFLSIIYAGVFMANYDQNSEFLEQSTRYQTEYFQEGF